ncbi:MAG: serine/threonine protein kinase [Burkholderiales bacterium]|nr:serine/threonine protein kinase [Burkholderiales bacterium]
MNSPPPRPDWQRVRALFERVAPLPQAKRDELLAGLAGEGALVAEVRSLLAHADAETHGVLSAGAAAVAAAASTAGHAADHTAGAAPAGPHESHESRQGQRVGPWRIRSLLGRGGMGEVWLAERDDGSFQGEAAIKLLRRGLDSRQVLARFALERQVLARLNHPHIARLLDAGTTEDGLPFFVMERVDGRALHEAALALPLAGRLALFLQLADAVTHAHRNLLVHRDLKPSNVLVNAEGQVKLLDFGIAKALDPLEDNDGLTTVGGARPFTPHYASPEQVRGEPVSTATDIYSLGVLLYQMLTGTRPTGRQATTAMEAARSVLEDEPTRPSRLSGAEATDPQWPTTRARLQGDLDNIVMKALEKDVARRYGSVEAMAEDVRAYLGGYPVGARAASPAYVLRKFLARNRWAVLAAGLGALGLVAGLVASVVQGRAAVAVGALGMGAGLVLALVQVRRTARARDEAQARFEDLRQLAHNVLFDYHDLVEPLVGSTPVRRRLVNDAITYLDRMARAAPSDRGVRLEIGMAWRTVGVVQRNGYFRPHLGDREGAMHSYAQAVAWLEPLVAEDERDDLAAFELALALSARAGVEAEEGDIQAARPLLLRAADLFRRHLEPDRPDLRHRLELARTHLRLASGHAGVNEPEPALQHIAQARAHLRELARRQPLHPELDHVWVWVHGVTKRVRRAQGQWLEVRTESEASLQIMQRLIAQQPDNARFLEDLAGLALWQLRAAGALGDVPAAEHWGRKASEQWGSLAQRDLADRVARRSHLDCRIGWGRELVRAGDATAGLRRLQEAAAVVEEACRRWPDDVEVLVRDAYLLDAFAQALHALGQDDGARAAAAQAQVRADALCERFSDDAAALTAQVVTRLTPAQWLGAAALAPHAAQNPADRVRAAQQALGALQTVTEQGAALARRRRLQDRGYAWRLQEVPALMRRLQEAAGPPR